MKQVEILKQESLPAYDVGTKSTVEPNETTLKQLGEYLSDRYRKLKSFREQSDWEREKAEAFNAYHMVPKKRPLPYPGASNLPCPLHRIGVDSFHANVMASVFSDGNQLKVQPLIIQRDFASTASKAARYMAYVMNHEADFYNAFDDADKKAQMFGVAYLEPTYCKEEVWETVVVTEEKEVPELNPMTQQVEFKKTTTSKKEKKKKTKFDGIKIESLPVESIYLSPFMKSLEQAAREDVVFKRFQRNWMDVKERSKAKDGKSAFYKKSQVDLLEPYIVPKIYKNLSELEQARAKVDGFFMDLLSRKEMLELAEAYLWWDIDNDGIEEEIKVTLHPDSGIVLRVTLSKCRIIDINPRPVDERYYGEGIPKIAMTLANEWEEFHNTRANAGQWENMPFFFYRAGGRFAPGKITLVPGHGYPVDDPREVVFPQTQRVGASYFQEEQLIMNYFERIFALDENMQGVSSRRSRTATETMRVSSRASIRFNNPFNRIVTQLNKLLDNVWELNQECAPSEKEFYVLGDGGAPLFDKMNKYDFSSSLRFGVAISSVFDQQLTRDTMLLAYRLFLVNPFVQQHPETMWELSQKTLDSLEVDVDLPKPPQAKVLSPFETIEMIRAGEDIEPEVGIDYDEHIKICTKQLMADDIKTWDVGAIERLILYIDKAKILKQTLESSNLNKSGRYTENPMPNQPGMTANRNPTQMFNTMKVAESGKSMMKNNQNGGANVESSMDQAMGPIS